MPECPGCGKVKHEEASVKYFGNTKQAEYDAEAFADRLSDEGRKVRMEWDETIQQWKVVYM